MAKFKYVHCKDGFGVSIQASKTTYCEPRNDLGPYTAVELGFPSASEPLIIGYAEDKDSPTETIYGWVPVGVVKALLIKHGGIESGTHPEFHMDTEQSTYLAETLEEISNETMAS
jgi:hypothetical protein